MDLYKTKNAIKNSDVIDITNNKILVSALHFKNLNINIRLLIIYNNWYKINGKYCYYKHLEYTKRLFNELLGEKLAIYMDLDTVHYKLAKTTISSGIISENFRTKDKIYFGTNSDKYIGKVVDILHEEAKDNKNIIDIMNKLKRLKALDFYSMQTDRHSDNFYFSKDKEGYLDLAPLFDYEDSFNYILDYYHRNFMHFNLMNKDELESIRSDYYMRQQFTKLLDLNINKVIDQILDEYNLDISKDLINDYKKHDITLKNKVKTYNLAK